MIDNPHRQRCIHGNIQATVRILVFPIEVATLCRFTDAIEAEDLQVRRERKPGLQGVHPLAMVLLVVFDFGAGMCHSMRVIIENLVFVPSITVFAVLKFRSQ